MERESRDRRFFWLALIGSYAALAGVLAVVFWQAGLLRSACSPNEEHCFREWVGALSGWAAAVVAVPTILFLSRQVRDAQKHHRQSIYFQMRQSRGLARQLIRSANDLSTYSQGYLPEVRSRAGAYPDTVETALVDLRGLHGKVGANVFRWMEETIGAASYSVGQMVADIEAQITKLEKDSGYLAEYRTGLEKGDFTLTRIWDDPAWFAAECIGIAERYLTDTESMVEPENILHRL